MEAMIGTKWLSRAVDGYTDRANDMHRGSEKRRSKATFVDFIETDGTERHWKKGTDPNTGNPMLSPYLAKVDKQGIHFKSSLAFACKRRFKLVSNMTIGSNQYNPVGLNWELSREPFNTFTQLPLIFGQAFNQSLKNRSNFSSGHGATRVSCLGSKNGAKPCMCVKDSQQVKNIYFNCKKNGDVKMIKDRLKESEKNAKFNEKYFKHWCPCHLQNVVEGELKCPIGKPKKGVQKLKTEKELRDILKSWMENQPDIKSLHELVTDHGLSVCSQYCGCNGLCYGNKVLATEGIRLFLSRPELYEIELAIKKAEERGDKDEADKLKKQLNQFIKVGGGYISLAKIEQNKIYIFALFNYLYCMYFNEQIDEQTQIDLTANFVKMIHNAFLSIINEKERIKSNKGADFPDQGTAEIRFAFLTQRIDEWSRAFEDEEKTSKNYDILFVKPFFAHILRYIKENSLTTLSSMPGGFAFWVQSVEQIITAEIQSIASGSGSGSGSGSSSSASEIAQKKSNSTKVVLDCIRQYLFLP